MPEARLTLLRRHTPETQAMADARATEVAAERVELEAGYERYRAGVEVRGRCGGV